MTIRPLLASIAVLAAIPASAQPRESMSRLMQRDHHFVDAAGRTVIIHGGNVTLPTFATRDDRWTAQTAARMAAQGFNGVRLVVFLSDIMPSPGRIDAGYVNRIARTVAAYKVAGIRTLIDFHQDEYAASVGVRGMPDWAVFSGGRKRMPGLGFPLGYFNDPAVQVAFDNFWRNHPVAGTGKGVQDLYVDALAAVARRFRNEPAVLGIDVMNEPATGSRCAQPDPVNSNCPELEQQLLRPFYTKASAAIHAAAPDMLVFVEPFMLQGALGTPIDTPIVAPEGRRGFSFHNYGPVQATRDRVNDGALSHAVRERAAIINTEWGFTNDAAEIDRQADDFDARGISWLAWTRGAFEALVDPSLPDRDNGNRAAVLRAYARPYPRAIAGTPEAIRFDSDTGVLSIRYTVRPGDRPRADGALTEILLPEATFPAGYDVSVDGASIVSAPGSRLLSIRNQPRASRVSIRVTRKGQLPPLAADISSANAADSAMAKLPPIPAVPLTRTSLLGHIVATPGGRAVLDREVPGMLQGLSHVHEWEAMTLASIQHFASGVFTDAKLAAIDAALGRLTVTPGPVSAPRRERLSIDSMTSDLLADPAARAIIEREAPGLADAPQQGLFPQTRLRNLRPAMPDRLDEAALTRIAAALADLP